MATKKDLNGPLAHLQARDTPLVPEDMAGEAAFPALVWCLHPKWREKKCVKESGTLSVKIVGPYYVVNVVDPTRGLQTSVTLESLAGLLEAVEARLADPGQIWTPTFDRVKKARQEARKPID